MDVLVVFSNEKCTIEGSLNPSSRISCSGVYFVDIDEVMMRERERLSGVNQGSSEIGMLYGAMVTLAQISK